VDRVVLITGASSGVGLALAGHLAGRYRVIALARRVERIREHLEHNPAVEAVRADLADERQTSRVLDGLLERFGYIPFLVNNAGVSLKAEIADLDARQAGRCMQVNALSPLLIMRKLLPGMRERNFGRIVNVTSGAPLNCSPGFGAYSASKAALNAFTVTAARECADLNIKINLMSPGPVRTGMAPDAPLDPSVCLPTADYLLELGEDGPTGRFFWLGYEIPLFPDTSGVHWLEGRADSRFARVV
jgi:NAD(P)-dependent dehydrogenase (short-subunit alcohol dehydrogenase family)